jgi:hypothetical protein
LKFHRAIFSQERPSKTKRGFSPSASAHRCVLDASADAVLSALEQAEKQN